MTFKAEKEPQNMLLPSDCSNPKQAVPGNGFVTLDPRKLNHVDNFSDWGGSVSSLESLHRRPDRTTPNSSIDLEWENDGIIRNYLYSNSLENHAPIIHSSVEEANLPPDLDNPPSLSVNDTTAETCSIALRSHASSQVSIPGLDWDSQVMHIYMANILVNTSTGNASKYRTKATKTQLSSLSRVSRQICWASTTFLWRRLLWISRLSNSSRKSNNWLPALWRKPTNGIRVSKRTSRCGKGCHIIPILTANGRPRRQRCPCPTQTKASQRGTHDPWRILIKSR